MRCNNCGIEYDPMMQHCPACGAPSAYNGQMGQVPVYQRPPYPTAVEIIRQIPSHKLFLPAAIIMSAYTVFYFLFASSLQVIGILTVIGLWLMFAEYKKKHGIE